MTIFFVSAHDAPTEANLAIAQAISVPADIQLFGNQATRAGLHAALTAHAGEATVFSMTHGTRHAVLDNQRAQAINVGDTAALANRKVFAWACETGASLGHAMAQSGITWWGYDQRVTAPDDRPAYLAIFSTVFATAKSLFPTGTDVASVDAVLELIRQRCEVALATLDALGAAQDSDAFSLYSCCHHVWQRLSVWLAGVAVPCRHPLAPEPYIDI